MNTFPEVEPVINPQVYKTQLCRGQIPPISSVNIKLSQPRPPNQDYADQNYRRLGIDDVCGDNVECPRVSPAFGLPPRSGASGGVLLVFSIFLAILTFPISLYFCVVVVPQFKRLIVYRNGRVLKMKALGPGLVATLPCIDQKKQIDLRTRSYCIPPQDVITKDMMTVLVDGVLFWRVADPMSAVCNISDYENSVHTLAGSALRNAVGTRDLSEIIKNRPGVSQEVYEQMRSLTKMWGIKIVRAEIKSIRMPIQMQKIMAQEADTQKLANAKISLAQAEVETVKNLQMATLILNQNPMGMQLRYLQTLHSIAGQKTRTIVMPFSLDLLRIVKRILEEQKGENTSKFPADLCQEDDDDEDIEISREELYQQVKKACSYTGLGSEDSGSDINDELDATVRQTLQKMLDDY